MLKHHGNDWTEGTHIVFRFKGMTASGKTAIFEVLSKDGLGVLGRVSWFGRWRKYSFDPAPSTTFEQTCLREIAEFIEMETQRHRQTA